MNASCERELSLLVPPSIATAKGEGERSVPKPQKAGFLFDIAKISGKIGTEKGGRSECGRCFPPLSPAATPTSAAASVGLSLSFLYIVFGMKAE